MFDEQTIEYLLAAMLAVGIVVMFVRILGSPSKRGKRQRFEGRNSQNDGGGGSYAGSSSNNRKNGEGDGDGGGTDSGGDGGGGGGD